MSAFRHHGIGQDPSPEVTSRESNTTKSIHGEPLAVIGLACRFPKDARDVESLWECLLEGRSMTTKIPKERFNPDGFYHPDPERGGSIYADKGHFLADSTAPFDAPFFNLSKNEVISMDPQQRILLENTYQALENAGIKLENVVGTPTSVFIGGGFAQDYLCALNQDTETILKNKGTGTSTSILANRVSWFYDLKGTSASIDTACSSSLVALHQACQDLRSGLSEMAVVSGVNFINFPGTMMSLGSLGLLSPDGKCYSFDHRANGYGRGEGVGTVIVKRLNAALRDGNTIRAIIRATGSNQDGRTPGIALPSGAAQERLIRSIYENAGLDMGLTRYVEAHGTGTAAGDPIEAGAVAAAFSSAGSGKLPIYIGSIKSNIGHLESAAGIAGLIKAILMVERGVIPPAANFEKVNSKIPLEEWNMSIATSPIPWPSGVRRVSVNSFGFGGTNAHVVVDDANSFLKGNSLEAGLSSTSTTNGEQLIAHQNGDAYLPNGNSFIDGIGTHDAESISYNMIGVLTNGHTNGRTNNHANGDTNGYDTTFSNGASHRNGGLSIHTTPRARGSSHNQVFICTTPDEAGISLNASKLSKHLRSQTSSSSELESQYLSSLAYTLAEKRSIFKWKSFCVASSKQDLATKLEHDLSKPIQKSRYQPKLGFIFTGQGAQWPAMGRSIAAYPVYRKSIEDASEFMASLGSPWLLKDVLLSLAKPAADMNDPFLSQAACAAVQIALVDLLASWNIVPSRVLGHSSGEIAAAYCAGYLTRQDAWKLAYFRGVVSTPQTTRKGAMVAVGISAEGAKPYLDEAITSKKLTIACYNSPKNITISGDAAEIDTLCATLERDGIFARKLAVRNAYHSFHMEAVADEYFTLIGKLSNGEKCGKGVEMISSVTGRIASEKEVATPTYWVQNLVMPVRFTEALLLMTSGRENKSGQRQLRIGSKTGGSSIEHVVEIGPHSALRSAVRDTLSTKKETSAIEYHHVMTRSFDDTVTVLSTAATLYCHSYPVSLDALNSQAAGSYEPRMLTDLPPYAFNRSKTYWKDSRLSKNYHQRSFPRHDLFGAPVADWNPAEPRWRGFLRLAELPWLKDHKITGSYIFPGVGYLVMALEALKQTADESRGIRGFHLRDVAFKMAMYIPDTVDGIEYCISMNEETETNRDRSSTWREFHVSTCHADDGSWTEHCTGLIMIEYDSQTGEVDRGREASAEAQRYSDILADAEAICNGQFGANFAYETWRDIGMEFGPTFRNLKDMRVGDGSGIALSTVTIPDVAKVMPKNFVHPHTIQPATLDSILQTFMMAIVDMKKNDRLRKPELPTFIKKVWISASIPNTPGQDFKCFSEAEQVSPTQYLTSIKVWDATTRQLGLILSGIETKPLEVDLASRGNATENMCYFIEWQPVVDLLSNKSQIFQNMLPESSLSLSAHRSQMTRCQVFAMRYIEETIDAIKDIESTQLSTHHQKYLGWLKYQAARISSPGSFLLEDTAALDRIRQNSFETVDEPSAREKLLHKLGPKIKPILYGEMDALELMFSDGDLMDRFYSESSAPANITPLLKSFLNALSHNTPSLKIIEIGAGTGSTTATILETLSPSPAASLRDNSESSASRIANYTYTDVSAGFFKRAKERFADWAGLLEFKMLDIECSPAEQGFETGTYDLVVASNVLHATSCLADTLKNARSLLKRGGKLLLVEVVQSDFLTSSLCFGLLPGWWLSSEPFRASGPLMSESQWDRILKEQGFSGLDLVLRDTEQEDLHEISVMVSTIDETEAYVNGIGKSRHGYIIVESSHQMNQPLTLSIKERLVQQGFNTCTIVDYHNLPSAEINLKDAVCISFIGLGETDLSEINESEYLGIKNILLSSTTLLWVAGNESQKPELAMATGLIRSVRWERDLDAPNLVLLNVEEPYPEPQVFVEKVLDCVLTPGRERNEEYMLKGDELWAPRVRESAKTTRYLTRKAGQPTPVPQSLGQNPRANLTTKSPGLLNKLVFENDPIWEKPFADTDVEVKIHAAGLNFLDVMIAMGQLAKMNMGFEASGVVTRIGSSVKDLNIGDRVVAFAAQKETGCFQSFLKANENAVVKISPQLSLDEAAAVPMVFGTVIYSLNHVARLSAGETILIHAGGGGIGQAAIQIAQLAGAEIFTTVSTTAKRDWLIKEYGLAEDHIFSSRNLSFVKGIMRMTNNRGVDVVLNSLASEALRRSWDCMAPFGRFIELGKKDILSNGKLSMGSFLKNVTYATIDLALVFHLKTKFAASLIKEALNLFEQGKLRIPRPLNIYSYADVETAFRYLQAGQAMGKTILKPLEDAVVQVLPETMVPLRLDSNASYVLSGGLGGIGRSLARWMHSRGARNLIFLSRSGAIAQESQTLIEDLEKGLCRVKVGVCDIGNEEQLKVVMKDYKSSMPPVKGCIQGSMVLEDSMFENMTYQQFQAAIGPKVKGSRNLQHVLGSNLDFFVMLSSITSIVGNRGQANYAAGNAYQDAFARELVLKGVKAISINLGTIKTVGYVAENKERVQKQGKIFLQWDQISEDQLHSIIEYHIDPYVDFNNRGARFQSITGLMTASAITSKGVPIPGFMSYPLFKQLHAVDLTVASLANETEFPIQKLLSSCDSLDAAAKYIEKALQLQLLSMMSVPKEEFDPYKPLVAYGVDSLIAVEIRTWISKCIGADVAIFDVLGRNSIVDFSAKVAGLSTFVHIAKSTNTV